jgi:serine/threonine-protein kinase
MRFMVGETLGPYQLIEQLGQGGMAIVFKAFHPILNRYMAIKVLHQAFTEDDNFLARFQRLTHLVAQLDHPNIVPIFDLAEYEGRPYLAMKFIGRETLKACLERGELELPEIRRIVIRPGSGKALSRSTPVGRRTGL